MGGICIIKLVAKRAKAERTCELHSLVRPVSARWAVSCITDSLAEFDRFRPFHSQMYTLTWHDNERMRASKMGVNGPGNRQSFPTQAGIG